MDTPTSINEIVNRSLDAMLDGKPLGLTRDEFKSAYRGGHISFAFTDMNGVQRSPRLNGVKVEVPDSEFQSR